MLAHRALVERLQALSPGALTRVLLTGEGEAPPAAPPGVSFAALVDGAGEPAADLLATEAPIEPWDMQSIISTPWGRTPSIASPRMIAA
ncbi:hypothetical protein G6F40_017336 [Rhizopus arrhizus]|nr:hypothetical protein G6F40_017336 [Rhizopus arrhizus]